MEPCELTVFLYRHQTRASCRTYACASHTPPKPERRSLPANDRGLTKCGLLTLDICGRLRNDWSGVACHASPTSPMLARLASVLRGTRATVTVCPEWVTARSTPALRSFCTEPSLKPHVHVSASKVAPTLFDACNPFALAVRAVRVHLARLVRDPTALFLRYRHETSCGTWDKLHVQETSPQQSSFCGV